MDNINYVLGLYGCFEFCLTFYSWTSDIWTFVFFLPSTWLGLPFYKIPAHPVSTPSNISNQLANFTSPATSNTPALNKRKESKIVSVAPPLAKKSRGKSSARTISQRGEYFYQNFVHMVFCAFCVLLITLYHLLEIYYQVMDLVVKKLVSPPV